MVAYSFQRRFVGHVQAGLEPGPWCPGMKRHTLRAPRLGRQGHARPEQPVHLYTAMRTKQCRKIGQATARVQIPLYVVWNGVRLFLQRREGPVPRSRTVELAPIVRELMDRQPGEALSQMEMEEFARTDGFETLAEMQAFFNPPDPKDMVVAMSMDMVLIGWSPT